MKKYFRNIAIFIVVIIVVDFCFGLACDYLNSHAKGGGVGKRYYIAKESNEQIMLFGSSRMSHHYIPQMIEDSLGMTCYNAGEDGNGIILSYGFLKMMLKRYTPDFIIYDISGFDLYQDDNMKYISLLKPFCEDEDVIDIITSVDSKEKYKLVSNLYRYNSLWIRMLGANLRPSHNKKGYLPIKGEMNYDPEINLDSNEVIDPLKLAYLKAFIKDCKENDIKLFFAVSPRYKGELFGEIYPELRSLCAEYDIPFWNYFDDTLISNNKQFFKDQTHMNEVGARVYTDMIVKKLQAVL